MPDLDNAEDVEDVDTYVLRLGLESGCSTQPERFSDYKLA
jgi:hypothetical protein